MRQGGFKIKRRFCVSTSFRIDFDKIIMRFFSEWKNNNLGCETLV